MAEHDHRNHHQAHPSADTAEDPRRLIGEELDPANRSLSEALQISFRLLSFIIVVLLVLYVFSGVFVVKPNERAIIVRFGKIVGATETLRGDVLESGLHISWPFPIDEVVRVSTSQQDMEIDTYRFYSAPGDEAKTLDEIRPVSQGLRPVYDGALMTGDRGLVHVTWACKYVVPDDPEYILDYLTNVDDVPGLIRSAIENASIRWASRYAVEPIWQSNATFAAEVKAAAQEFLDRMNAGVRIQELQYAETTPPLQALRAFRDVTVADQERKKLITEAEQRATQIRLEAAGENLDALAGAIREYERALDAQDEAVVGQAFETINTLLMSSETTGNARRTIDEALAYRAEVIQRARQADERFSKLLPAYRTTPELTISREWTQAAQDILSGESIVKWNWPGNIKSVLYVHMDPDVARDLKRLEAEAELQQQQSPGQQRP